MKPTDIIIFRERKGQLQCTCLLLSDKAKVWGFGFMHFPNHKELIGFGTNPFVKAKKLRSQGFVVGIRTPKHQLYIDTVKMLIEENTGFKI